MDDNLPYHPSILSSTDWDMYAFLLFNRPLKRLEHLRQVLIDSAGSVLHYTHLDIVRISLLLF